MNTERSSRVERSTSSRFARRSSARISESASRQVGSVLGGEQPRGALDVEVPRRLLLEAARRRREISIEEAALGRARARGRRAGRRSSARRARGPARRSLRKLEAHSTRPGSTGRSKLKTRFVTAPLEAITTTITTRGCSCRTSTRCTRARRRRRRGRDREQVGHPRERRGRLAQRLLDLAPHPGQVERRRVAGPRRGAGGEQRVGVEAIARVGRHPPGGGVRMGEEALALERRELGPHRRAAPTRGPRASAIAAEPDGLARLEVGVDGEAEDPLLALAQHRSILGSRFPNRPGARATAGARARPRRCG